MTRRKLIALVRAGITAVGVVVMTLVLGTVALVAVTRDSRTPVVDRLARVWSRIALILAGVRLEIRGRDRIDPGRSYVVVSNHLSDLDVAVNVLSVPVGIRFLAKKELFRIPFFGRVLRAIGMVETDRQAGRRAHEDINRQIAHTVRLGHSLMIYPEGTRARDGKLHDFKKGAFRIAIDNQMDVVPVSIVGTYEAWPAATPFLYGGEVTVTVHDPISVQDLGPREIAQVQKEAFAAVEEGIAAIMEERRARG